MCVRSAHFYSERRLVIRDYTSLDRAGCKASGITNMAVTQTSERDRMLLQFICAFSGHIHVFM